MIKTSNPIFPAPISSPPPREAEASAPLPKNTPKRGCGRPCLLRSDPLSQLWRGGREPLPTDNSHFFAARFRNTLGLMPSGELCNQGHRSRAKQTRQCVCSGGPRGAQGAGRGSGPASGPACLLRRTARVPRPAGTAALPLPHRRPRLGPVNFVPSPRAATAERPGIPVRCENSRPGGVLARHPSCSPRDPGGRRAAVGGGVTAPSPRLGWGRRGWPGATRAPGVSACPRGEGWPDG